MANAYEARLESQDIGTYNAFVTAMTTFVVEWGSEWNVQHVNVAEINGGDGLHHVVTKAFVMLFTRHPFSACPPSVSGIAQKGDAWKLACPPSCAGVA